MKILLTCGKISLVSAMKKIVKSKDDDEFHCFVDCRKALEWIFREKMDLIIIDLKMFNGEGIDFLKKVKKIQPEAKIIGISNSKLHRKYYLERGCHGFLRSQFGFDDFRKELDYLFPQQSSFDERKKNERRK